MYMKIKGKLSIFNSLCLITPLFEATKFPLIYLIVNKKNEIHIKSEFSQILR